jgi:hypothetical protein
MKIIGVAGTAKNTGKTTTTVSIINNIPDPSVLCVTSIGYDGEAIDNVTGLPKPRLHLPAGSLVVTAENCLSAGSAIVEKLEAVDIYTALGRLVIGRVQRAGLVVLAGPNNEGALRVTISLLEKFNLSLLLVDGALNRLAPMSATHGLIIATGASRSTNQEQLLLEASSIEYITSLPVSTGEGAVLTVPSLLVESNIGVWPEESCFNWNTVDFTGVVDISPFSRVAETLKLFSPLPALLFRDPVKLLLCGDLPKMRSILQDYTVKGGKVGVRFPLPLLAVTVNPFYPLYNQANGEYTCAVLDPLQLHQLFGSGLKTPVVDVVRQGGEMLAAIILKHAAG